MTELSRKIINRNEMMNRAITEFMKLNSKKSFQFQGKINSEKHECILTVSKEIANSLNAKISIPNDWDKKLPSLMDNSGIAYREVVLHYKWQKEDCGILVAFWKENNFPVALIPHKNGYKMFDPQTMSWQKVTSKVTEKFSPNAYCFYNLFPDKEITPKSLLRFALKQFDKHDLISLAILTFAVSVTSLFFPMIMGFILDEAIPLSQHNSMFTVGAFLLMFLPAQFIFYIMQMLIQVRIETKTCSTLQTAVWHRILHYKTSFFRKFSVGDLVSRINNTGKIQRVLQENFLVIIFSLFLMVINSAMMIFYNVKISLIIFFISSIWLIFMIPLNSSLLKLQSEITNHNGQMSGFLLQLIKGISKIQASSNEYTLFSRWAAFFTPILKKEQKKYFLQSKMQRQYLLMQSFAIVTVYYLVSKKVNLFSAGQFAAFFTALSFFLAAMWEFYEGIVKCLTVAAEVKRIEPIFKETPQICGVSAPPGTLSGAIDVQHVTFRYSQGSPAILKNISLSIKPGEFVAFVGSSGCGKSTLMRLLLGFETPESGCIKVDGQDLATLDSKMVRKQFGVVLQNGKLLPGDVYSNIAGGIADLPMEEAWKAAELAGIADDIKEMPMGMFTQISDSGGNFSGGQRQRLLIARAIARKPKILLFDEATSALDNKTQALVSQSIEKLNATRIAIAHRISTIKNADKIFVFSKGGIEETGTYEELMNAQGTFYQLAKRQMI